MGIKDLLRFMKPYVQPIHIKKYAGQRVGIDAYSWLHKGAYSCSMELCLNVEGNKKLQYLRYFMDRINLLRHHKITPVVVLDGGDLPFKSATHDERERKRQANRDLAMEKLKEGDTAAASELFQRGMSITSAMAHQLVQTLRSENIEYVVAPYEADAQLAFMSSIEAEKGGIVAVISEDSDLLAYGCPSVIFKMDKYGNGEEMILNEVFSSSERIPTFRNFDMQLFTGMCVLAGCDFLPSIPGIGIAKAHNLVSKYRNLDRVLSVLELQKGKRVPENYSKSFKEAVAVFQHARVYDVALKQLKHLKPITETLLQSSKGELDFLGPEVSPAFATAIARGDIDPCTMEAFNQNPSNGIGTNATQVITTNDWQITEATSLPSKEGCFSVVSSKSKTQGASTTEQKKAYPRKIKDINKDSEVEKLITTLKEETTVESRANAKKEIPNFPDNNPFKKKKQGVLPEEKTENVTEDVSVVTEIENPEIIHVKGYPQLMVESKSERTNSLNSKVGRKEKRRKCGSLPSDKRTMLSFFSRV